MKELHRLYKEYAQCLRNSDIEGAKVLAMRHNDELKRLGGEKKNPGEFYLTLGKRKAVRS